MNKYAIVKIQGKQYKIHEGEEILVDKMDKNSAQFDVLLFVNDDKVLIGKPVVKKIMVNWRILEDSVKGKKLYVSKYKAKSRYRRKMGFRPQYSKLLIDKISL